MFFNINAHTSNITLKFNLFMKDREVLSIKNKQLNALY